MNDAKTAMQLRGRRNVKQLYWIQQRDNPQTETYWVAYGQISTSAAKRMENAALYGATTMHSFRTERAYNARLNKLRKTGVCVY